MTAEPQLFEDDAAASQHVSTQLSGRVVTGINVCSGDEEHPSHVDITFSNGVVNHLERTTQV